MRSSTKSRWRPRDHRQWFELGVALVLAAALAVLVVIDYKHFRPAAPDPVQTKPTAPVTRSYHAGEPAATGKRMLSAKGTGSERTASFTAKEPWSLYWDFECASMPPNDTFKITFLRSDGSLSRLLPISKAGESGYGNQPYSATGTFKIQVTSPCDWHVIVSYEH